MARKANTKREPALAPAQPAASPEGAITARVVVGDEAENSPLYINFAEISHSRHEFMMHCLQLPTKLGPTMRELVMSSGELRLSPVITILMPPTLIPGLIKALTLQMEKYQQQHGTIETEQDEEETK